MTSADQPNDEVQQEQTVAQPMEKTAPRAAVNVVPNAEQLALARAAHWHQNETPVLSLEALRDWVNRSGLVLYAPRAQQLPSPAPSLLEAVLGKSLTTVDLAETEAARTLLARLIAEGSAVPLNLLGATGAVGTDVPDFIVSAAVFSYVFTLRGNKAWKQAPVTSGPVKVSPLGLATYEILAAKVTLSAYDLTTQLGKEVTEVAVLRALTELWSQLRVIPVAQLDGSATLWELSTSRFTKQIKSGANAGQPTALSALISLYLGQALVATEEEIETFLSPVAPRSRVRGILHDLLGARQLQTIVIDGKTLLHVTGDLPAFAAVPEAEVAAVAEGEATSSEPGSRISKFTARPGSKLGTGLRAKPAFGKKPFGAKAGYGAKPGYGKPAYGKADRERRPFRADEARPTFSKPWEEEKQARMEAAADAPAGDGAEARSEGAAAPRTYTPRPAGERPAFRGKPAFGAKPRFEGRREGFGGRGHAAGDSRPPRREFAARTDGARGGEGGEAPRRTFSKPGTFGRKREGGFAGKPAFGREGGGESRPPRRDFSAGAGGSSERPARSFDRGDRPAAGPGGVKRPGSYTPRPSGGAGGFGARPGGFAGKSFGERAERPRAGDGAGGEAPRKVFRKFDAPRDKKPFGAKPFGAKPFGAKPSGAKPFGAKPFGAEPFGAGKSFGPDGPARPARAGGFSRAEGGGDARSARPSFGGKPGGFSKPGGFAKAGPKKPFSKAAGFAKAGGPFAKFADGQKPFRKPGQPRKPAAGGYAPTRRKRSGEGE